MLDAHFAAIPPNHLRDFFAQDMQFRSILDAAEIHERSQMKLSVTHMRKNSCGQLVRLQCVLDRRQDMGKRFRWNGQVLDEGDRHFISLHTIQAWDHAARQGPIHVAVTLADRIDCLEDRQYKVYLNNYASGDSRESKVVDYVITAIGQHAENLLPERWTQAGQDSLGRIKDGACGLPDNVFVAGDLLADNHQSLIGAIGSGKKAAVAVRKALENYAYDYEGQAALDNLTAESTEHRTFSTLLASADINFDPGLIHEKIAPFNLHQTCERCNHCIDNFGCPSLHKLDGHVVINQQSCIRCGLCIDVCPNNAIHWTAELDLEIQHV